MAIKKRKSSEIFFKICQSKISKRIDLRKKKMRRIMLVLLTLMACNLSHAQKRHRCIAGIDLADAISSHELGLFYGIAIEKNLSICAGTSIRLPFIADEAEVTHREDLLLEENEVVDVSKDLVQARISAQYWAKRQFDGLLISFGLGTSQSRNLDCPIEIGYMCPIGKAARVSLGYSLEMIDTFRQHKLIGKGLCVRIAYEF